MAMARQPGMSVGLTALIAALGRHGCNVYGLVKKPAQRS
jgi:hypothetical protein